MIFIARQEAFGCEHCGCNVEPLRNGSYRNHCPQCLYSKHVDEAGPGDRLSLCLGMMEPIRIDQHAKKGWMIVHRCNVCQKEIRNTAAPDDDLSGFMKRETDRYVKENPKE
jgi:hypothetical protein